MKRAKYCLSACLLWLPMLATAGFFDKGNDQSSFLTADQAFVLETVALDTQHVQARWTIAPEHYLYRHRLKIEWLDADGGTLSWQPPPGMHYQDEHFGDVEIYHDVLDIPIRLSQPAGSVRLRFHWQGCAEAGLCYPPQKRDITLELTP